MALTTAVFVGDSHKWVDELAAKAKSFKIGAGKEDGIDLAPVAYKDLKDRIVRIIKSAPGEGAKIVLDGSDFVHPQFPQGNFVAPTIIDNVTTNMTCYKE